MEDIIKIGDCVKVKKGIFDFDLNKYDMSDWQGRVQSLDTDLETGELLFLVEWDSLTLKGMPHEFISISLKDGFDFSEMYLGERDVLKSTERDTIFDVQQIQEIFERAHYWDNYGEQEARIKSVNYQCKNSFGLIDTWFDHLEKNVGLPCKIIYVGDSTKSFRYGEEIILDGIWDRDDHYGVIGRGKLNRKTVHFPLCDVKPVSITPENQSLDDYAVWFANH